MNWFEQYLLGKLINRVYKRREGMFKNYVSKGSSGLMVLTGFYQMIGDTIGVDTSWLNTTPRGWALVLMGALAFGIARKLATLENK